MTTELHISFKIPALKLSEIRGGFDPQICLDVLIRTVAEFAGVDGLIRLTDRGGYINAARPKTSDITITTHLYHIPDTA